MLIYGFFQICGNRQSRPLQELCQAQAEICFRDLACCVPEHYRSSTTVVCKHAERLCRRVLYVSYNCPTNGWSKRNCFLLDRLDIRRISSHWVHHVRVLLNIPFCLEVKKYVFLNWRTSVVKPRAHASN